MWSVPLWQEADGWAAKLILRTKGRTTHPSRFINRISTERKLNSKKVRLLPDLAMLESMPSTSGLERNESFKQPFCSQNKQDNIKTIQAYFFRIKSAITWKWNFFNQKSKSSASGSFEVGSPCLSSRKTQSTLARSPENRVMRNTDTLQSYRRWAIEQVSLALISWCDKKRWKVPTGENHK